MTRSKGILWERGNEEERGVARGRRSSRWTDRVRLRGSVVGRAAETEQEINKVRERKTEREIV